MKIKNKIHNTMWNKINPLKSHLQWGIQYDSIYVRFKKAKLIDGDRSQRG